MPPVAATPRDMTSRLSCYDVTHDAAGDDITGSVWELLAAEAPLAHHATDLYLPDFYSVTGDTYTTGGAVSLTCVLQYGVGGDLPDSANWTGITDETTSVSNTVDDPIEGTMTTVLSFTDYEVGVNSTGSPTVYTCLFWYDDMSFDDTVTVYPRCKYNFN